MPSVVTGLSSPVPVPASAPPLPIPPSCPITPIPLPCPPVGNLYCWPGGTKRQAAPAVAKADAVAKKTVAAKDKGGKDDKQRQAAVGLYF